MVADGFPMGSLWIPNGFLEFPMGSLWVPFVFPMVPIVFLLVPDVVGEIQMIIRQPRASGHQSILTCAKACAKLGRRLGQMLMTKHD